MTPEQQPLRLGGREIDPDVFEALGTKWRERARLGFQGALDPTDERGLLNLYRDGTQKSALSRHLRLTGRETVLDFGCGVGRLSTWLAAQAKRVIGVDLCHEMLDKAREMSAAPNIDYVLSDGLTIPLDAGSVDLVISVTVLQYPVRDAEVFDALAGEISRVLKVGGRLLMIEQALRGSEGTVYWPETYIKAFERHGLEHLTHYPVRNCDTSVLAELFNTGVVPPRFLPFLAAIERLTMRASREQIRRITRGSGIEYLFAMRKVGIPREP